MFGNISYKAIKLINYFTKTFVMNNTQNLIPIINQLQYQGCNNACQLAVYYIGPHLGLSVKVIAIILLFL